MKKSQASLLLLVGILIGALLAKPAAYAVTTLVATPSVQKFFVNGKQVELEAYGINGHNYVKLRDIGQVANFDVAYDPADNSVWVEPDRPYSGKDIVHRKSANAPDSYTDFSELANPAIFKGELTREAYNGLKTAVLHQGEILAGTFAPPSVGAAQPTGPVDQASNGAGRYPLFEIVGTEEGQAVCNVRYPESYTPAVEHTADFIKSLVPLTDTQKVERIVWYVADRISYQVKYTSPRHSSIPGHACGRELHGLCILLPAFMRFGRCSLYSCSKYGAPVE